MLNGGESQWNNTFWGEKKNKVVVEFFFTFLLTKVEVGRENFFFNKINDDSGVCVDNVLAGKWQSIWTMNVDVKMHWLDFFPVSFFFYISC